MHILSSAHLRHCQFTANRYIALSRIPRPERIAELGVLAGDLSAWMLEKLNPEELHLMDFFQCADFPDKGRFRRNEHEQFVRDRFRSEIEKGQVQLHKGCTWEKLGLLPDHSLDLIYIDAGHDYESVHKDLTVSIQKIRPHGRIALNDYIMHDHLAHTDYGVVQATNQFCVENDWEFEFFAFHPNLFCDVVLKKINVGGDQ